MMGINTQEMLDVVANTVNWSAVAVDMGWIKEAADSFANTAYNQLYLSSLITPENLSAVQSALGEAGSRVFSINFDFLGLADLSQIPKLQFWTIAGGFGLFLLPVISAVSGFLFSLLSMKTNSVNQKSAEAANNATTKSMLIMSPLMSLWIGFAMPAALCVYWIANNLLSMLQELVCHRLLKKDYEKAAAMQAERERQEKEEEKERKRLAAEERARRLEEEKKNKGKKKKGEKKPADEDRKLSAAAKEASRVGMRQYARGRTYDPYRYSADGPTPYPGEEPLFVPQDCQTLPDGGPVPPEAEEEAPPALEQEVQSVSAPGSAGEEAEAPYAQEAEESEETE